MNQISVLEQRGIINPEEIQIMKDSYFKDFTDSEVSFCVAIANQVKLHPLLRQIHFVKRFNDDLKRYVITPQTGIDGYRLIAERSGKYAGSELIKFEYAKDDAGERAPLKATVTVYKIVEGQKCAFTASARWAEFYPATSKQAFMWKKMPHNQLEKCAEALALRKAFPAELSGIYTNEEMEQADSADKATAIQGQLKPTSEVEVNAEVQPHIIKKPEAILPKSEHDVNPLCCGKPMSVSKFNPNQLYCHNCKRTAPKGAA